jgi:hypothetical protein
MPPNFSPKAPRAYTTPRQDARPCRRNRAAVKLFRHGEHSDALPQLLLFFITSLLLCFAVCLSAITSGERFSSPGAIQPNCRSLFRNGRFELRSSRSENFAAGNGTFANGRKLAALNG